MRYHLYATQGEAPIYHCGCWGGSLVSVARRMRDDLRPDDDLIHDLPTGLERNGHRALTAREQKTFLDLLCDR